MQGYVKAKNGASNEQHRDSPPAKNLSSNEDLKVSTKVPKTDHHRKSGQSQQQRQGRVPDEGRHFYDTDEPSIDRTSTVASLKREHPSQVAVSPINGMLDRSIQQDEDAASSEGSYASESEDDQPCEIGTHLTKQQREMRKGMKPALHEDIRGSQLPYMPGDSYPSTTSGRMSNIDAERYEEIDAQNWNKPQQVNEKGGKGGNKTQRHQQDAPQNRQAQPFAQPVLFARHNLDEREIEQEVRCGFACEKPALPKVNLQRPGPVPSSNKPKSIESRNSPSNNSAQPASVPVASNITAQIPQNPHKPERTVGQSTHVVRQDHGQRPGSLTESCTSGPVLEPVVIDSRHERRGVHVKAAVEVQSSSQASFESETSDHSHQLDYDVLTLYTMDFDDLRNQSFDVDPNAQQFDHSTVQRHDSLEEKLANVMSLEQGLQFSFFDSLSLNEWEQAGDWFLGRFGEGLSKLKNARQEKRRVAQEFEDEIKERNEAIGKKRKLIEASLGEMKENGGKVLAGTPKKKAKMK